MGWPSNAQTEWDALLDRFAVLEKDRDDLVRRVSLLERPPAPPPAALLLNRDLSTGDLSQYTNRDFGLGTNQGGNGSGGGFLYHHPNVGGRRAAGLTATPTAAAGGIPSGSDAVYLWDPVQPWGQSGQEWWLRTSMFFPSKASASLFSPGEAPYSPTTGEWNWLLELHKDLSGGPSTLALGMLTDYPVSTNPGSNPRLRLRLAYGNESSPTFVGKELGPLIYDKWYDMMFHVKLDVLHGIVEWFVDGLPQYSNLDIPTLFNRNGVPSKVNLTVANYRLHAAWASTWFLGPLVIGASRSAAEAALA